MKGSKRKGLQLMGKISAVVAVPMVVLVVISSVIGVRGMESISETLITEQLQNGAYSFSNIMNAVSDETYRYENQTLYKGDFNVTENQNILEEFKEKQGSLPVDEEWHYRKIVDPDGKIYSLTYVESLLRQYQSAENTIEEYYAKAHQDNLSQGSITDGMNYLSMKYTEFGLITGSP